jgi:HK97 family phage portal protein
MGLLSRLERREYAPSLGHPRDPALVEWFGGGARSISGASVTADSAFSIMSVYRAVRLIANTIASLPFDIYEVKEDGTRAVARKHPLSALIRRRPNRWQTAFEWKQMMGGHRELRGMAFSEIFTDGRGRVTELIPLHPDRVTPRSGVLSPEVGETIWFEYRPQKGAPRMILWDEMLYFRGYSDDGLTGLSPITIARETLGLALSNREYAARYLSNNSTPGGVITHPKTLSKEAKKHLRESWEEKHGGVSHTGKVAIFEEDMKWQSIGFNPKDSQFIEQRRFDNEEIARMFDLPPHKLMDLDRSTNNNIEHQAMEYVSDCILPRSVSMEETMERDLLLPSDEDRFFIEANLEGLLRGDSVSRGDFYTKLFNLGAVSPNDIARKENFAPADGGDQRFVPLNMVPLEQAGQLPDPAADPNADPNADDPKQSARAAALKRRILRAHNRLFADALGRVLRKEVQAARRAIDQGVDNFRAWLSGFYLDHETHVARALRPVVHTTGEAIASAVADELRAEVPATIDRALAVHADLLARAHVAASIEEFRRILRDVPAAEQLEQLRAACTDWETRRADRDAPKAAEDVATVATLCVQQSTRAS